MNLTDTYLITVFEKNLNKLEFPETIKKYLTPWFIYVKSLESFKKNEFSFFEYVTISRLAKKNYSNENEALLAGVLEPRDLWKKCLQSAIFILKKYDLRENPTFHSNSTYSIDESNLPSIKELSDYYEDAREFEKILYGGDPWYRDHFAHVLRVWLLGVYVIFELENKITKPTFGECDGKVQDDLFFNVELFAAFTISALCHDLGYPLEKIEKLNKKIGEILNSFGGIAFTPTQSSFNPARHTASINLLTFLSSKVMFFDDNLNGQKRIKSVKIYINNFIKERKDFKSKDEYESFNETSLNEYRIILRSQWKYFEKYFDSLEKYSHGLLSSMLLQRKLLYFKEGEFAFENGYTFTIEEARQFILRREIMRSISSHTSDDIYIINPLNLEALLFFVDEIQEWGRPFFSDIYGSKYNENLIEVIIHSYSDDVIDWEVKSTNISLRNFLYWLLSVGRKYSIKLRPAPESFGRKFDLKWKISTKIAGVNISGIFESKYRRSPGDSSKTYSIIIKNEDTNNTKDLTEKNEELDSGQIKDITSLVDEILFTNSIRELLDA